PGIRYVVDTGLARISRYSYRTKVQRLPIEPVSRASADQRAGRCGRVAPGICIRLYSEEDYQSRPEFTDPEILRTNLASVILQMKFLRLGDIEAFPFVEAPDPRYVRDGLKLLHELGAVDPDNRLTDLGRRVARLPVDPRIARILLAGDRERALSEVLVIAAALSIQDPRERPMEARAAADEAHARWQDPKSDFVGLLNLWREYRDQAHHLTQRKLRRWCRDSFVSYIRMREWRDIHGQLRELVKGMGLRENDQPAEYAPLHKAVLSGFLSNIALRTDSSEYTGARNLKLLIFPGSSLANRRPKWIVAAELVETSRVFARTVAEVRPEYIEPLAGHLVNRRYYEPYWDEKKGRVGGFEDINLYGLPLVNRRRINYAAVDPAEARRVFIREALVPGRLRTRGRFLKHNRDVIARIEELEAKSRRRDVLVDEDVLAAFYDERLPAKVADGPAFEKWVAEPANDRSLTVTREQLMEREAVEVTGDEYPDHLEVDGLKLPLSYHFEPGHPADGVTVRLPLAALNQVRPEPFEWLVPGLLEEKVVTLIRSLPKTLRKNFVPAPDFARAVLDAVPPREGSLVEAVRLELKRMTGVEVPLDAWDGVDFPAHLRMNFQVVDAEGKTVEQGRELRRLQGGLEGRAEASFSGSGAQSWERDGLRRWDFGELPEHLELDQGGVTIRGYPAVVDEGDAAALRLLDSPERAMEAHRAGVRRLFMLAQKDQVKYLRRKLPHIERLCLLYTRLGRCETLKEDILAAVFDRVFFTEGVPRDEAAFQRCLENGRGELVSTANDLAETLLEVLTRYQAVCKHLKGGVPLTLMASRQDIQEQLDALVYPGFVRDIPRERLGDLPRYLQGIERRLERLAQDPQKDEAGLRAVRPLWEQYRRRREQQRNKGIDDPELARYRWLLEEYRVSVFAQELGTRDKVSAKRLDAQWQQVR
ncbi:MAG: ATP-dependent RNA helicase HrpA, partial [Ectothiorhodospiraceae bacterium]